MRGGSDSGQDFFGKKGDGYGRDDSDFFDCHGAMGNGSSFLVYNSGEVVLLSKREGF